MKCACRSSVVAVVVAAALAPALGPPTAFAAAAVAATVLAPTEILVLARFVPVAPPMAERLRPMVGGVMGSLRRCWMLADSSENKLYY